MFMMAFKMMRKVRSIFFYSGDTREKKQCNSNSRYNKTQFHVRLLCYIFSYLFTFFSFSSKVCIIRFLWRSLCINSTATELPKVIQINFYERDFLKVRFQLCFAFLSSTIFNFIICIIIEGNK